METLRAAVRSLCIVTTFFLLVPLHMGLAALGHHDIIPPLFLRLVGFFAGLRVTIKGRPSPGALMLANHISWLDILGLAGACQSTFVAHSGLASHGLLKWLCEQNDTVFITRERRHSVSGQAEQLRSAFGKRPVTLFPEGSTNDGTGSLPFKSALLSAVESLAQAVPVQPVALEYRDVARIAWLGAEPGMDNVRRILSRKGRVDLTIHFLPPLEGEALSNRKSMAAAAQAAVAEALHLPPRV